MSIDHGRSPDGSGCQPAASAAEVASSQSGIPNAELRWSREQFSGDYVTECGRFRIHRYHDERDNFYELFDGGIYVCEFRNKMEHAFALASAIEAAAAGETTKIGSTEGESAVPEGQTPEPPSSTNPNTERLSL